MFINHLIIGAKDSSKTADFYCQLLDFEKTNDDPGTQGGQALVPLISDLSISIENKIGVII